MKAGRVKLTVSVQLHPLTMSSRWARHSWLPPMRLAVATYWCMEVSSEWVTEDREAAGKALFQCSPFTIYLQNKKSQTHGITRAATRLWLTSKLSGLAMPPYRDNNLPETLFPTHWETAGSPVFILHSRTFNSNFILKIHSIQFGATVWKCSLIIQETF